jgi:hypothetical protein
MSTVMLRGAGVRFNPVLGPPLPGLVDVLGTSSRETIWMLAFLQRHLVEVPADQLWQQPMGRPDGLVAEQAPSARWSKSSCTPRHLWACSDF